MQPLPIDPLLPELCATLRRSPSLVLEAPPGAGKTTRVPRALLDAGFAAEGEILVLEPRRLAARMAARRVAEELGEEVGGVVGYQMRFEDVSSARTRVRFVTEGTLTRRLLRDRELRGVSVVLLDEFHERHLDGDVALALLRRLQLGPRPDLRLAVMSATLDAGPVAAFLGEAPRVRSEGRLFEVAVEHLAQSDDRPLESQVASAVRRLVDEGLAGDVLVFLPGALEIRRAAEACANVASDGGSVVLPLHGSLSPAEQDRAVRPAGRRKVILSTNVAETSVTIDGVVAVVDSGLARVAAALALVGAAHAARGQGLARLGDAARGASGAHAAGAVPAALHPRAISWRGRSTRRPRWRAPISPRPRSSSAPRAPGTWRASAGSRRRRRPRSRLPRACWRGWAPSTGAAPSPPPASACCGSRSTRAWGASSSRPSAAGSPPMRARWRRSSASVTSPPAAAAPATPATARTCSTRWGASTRPRRPASRPSGCAGWGFDPLRAASVERVRKQLVRLVDRRVAPAPRSPEAWEEAACIAILAGYPDRVGRLRRPAHATGRSAREVVLAGGGTAALAESSGVADVDLVVAVDVEERTEVTGPGRVPGRPKAVVRMASAVEADWLLELFTDTIRDTTEATWNASAERVEVVRRLSYDGLVLEETRGAKGDPAAIARVLADAVRAKGWRAFARGDDIDQWLLRAAFVHEHCPELGFPALDEAGIEAQLAELCEGSQSFADLREHDLAAALRDRLGRAARPGARRAGTRDRGAPRRAAAPRHLRQGRGAERGVALAGLLRDEGGAAHRPRAGAPGAAPAGAQPPRRAGDDGPGRLLVSALPGDRQGAAPPVSEAPVAGRPAHGEAARAAPALRLEEQPRCAPRACGGRVPVGGQRAREAEATVEQEGARGDAGPLAGEARLAEGEVDRPRQGRGPAAEARRSAASMKRRG